MKQGTRYFYDESGRSSRTTQMSLAMKIQGIVIWCLLYGSLSGCFANRKDQDRDFYTAAVFEHRFAHDKNDVFEVVKAKNLNIFQKAAEVASHRGADIIVFPEYGLFPYVPNRTIWSQYAENVPDPTKEESNPCNERHKFTDRPMLFTLSCMAQKNKMYVVANTGDKQPCTVPPQVCDTQDIANCNGHDKKCPEDGIFIYNSNVAFDREGNLIAKYHKVHPYFEIVNVPDDPNYTTFETEFGTFALIVCFDSVFKYSVDLVEKFGVDTLIFPTFWFDDILPLNAIEFQQAWALSNEVNFLAANAHHPGTGSLGSGIYSKDFGALAYTYDPDGKSKLLVARVPLKKKSFKPQDPAKVIIITENGFKENAEKGKHFPEHCYKEVIGELDEGGKDYICTKRQMQKYSLVKLEGQTGRLEACVNSLCCSVSYDAVSMVEDYFLAVFNGTNDVKGFFHWWEENCFLIKCDSLDDAPCASLPSRSKTVFKSIEIKANLTTDRIYPTVTKSYQRLAPKSEWNIKVVKKTVILNYRSDSNEPLLKAGFVGRSYGRDPPFKPWFK